jgi:hypothetical protein
MVDEYGRMKFGILFLLLTYATIKPLILFTKNTVVKLIFCATLATKNSTIKKAALAAFFFLH